MPSVVLERAKTILNELDGKESYTVSAPVQLSNQTENIPLESVAPSKAEIDISLKDTTQVETLVAETVERFEVVNTPPSTPEPLHQMNLFDTISSQHEPVIEKLREIDVMRMTPIEALETLYDLQKQLR